MPGHTLASITSVIGDAAFIHDTIFMPDSGTARADFPGGNAAVLWKSIQTILSLPDETRLFRGHDYRPGGRNTEEFTRGAMASLATVLAHLCIVTDVAKPEALEAFGDAYDEARDMLSGSGADASLLN